MEEPSPEFIEKIKEIAGWSFNEKAALFTVLLQHYTPVALSKEAQCAFEIPPIGIKETNSMQVLEFDLDAARRIAGSGKIQIV